jgi:hypothetical protein
MEELHCPECGSIVYSRLNPVCGVCGKALPDSFRFEGAQAAILEGELEHARRDLQAVSDDKATQDEGFTPPDPLFLEDATDDME